MTLESKKEKSPDCDKCFDTYFVMQTRDGLLSAKTCKCFHCEKCDGSGKIFEIDEIERSSVRFCDCMELQKRLRGFNTRKIGPKDGEDYIGGNYISTLNFEASLPNLLPESTRTDISFFTDFGNIWSVDYDSSINDTNEIRSSVGLAANVWTPVGPLSFTVAEDLSKSINDETQTFNFRIGTSF